MLGLFVTVMPIGRSVVVTAPPLLLEAVAMTAIVDLRYIQQD